jgi:hypothetical protein
MIFGEWSSGRLGFCCLGLIAGELVFFFFFFDFLATGLLLFRFLYIWFDWFYSPRLSDCRSRGCMPKISYMYDIGRKKKKTEQIYSHMALITRGYKCPNFLENKIAFSGWHVAKRHMAK